MKKSEIDMIDGFAATTDIILDATENIPVAGKIVSLWKAGKTVRDALFERKLTAFWEEFQRPKVDKVLLAQTFSNFRKEYTEDYFDESLYNVIEKSDSVLRTKMISRLLILCSTGEIPEGRFWEVLFALQNLLMSDLKKLPRLLFIEDKLGSMENPELECPELISEMDKVSDTSFQRLGAVGLVFLPSAYGGRGKYKFHHEFANLVCRCLPYGKNI